MCVEGYSAAMVDWLGIGRALHQPLAAWAPELGAGSLEPAGEEHAAFGFVGLHEIGDEETFGCALWVCGWGPVYVWRSGAFQPSKEPGFLWLGLSFGLWLRGRFGIFKSVNGAVAILVPAPPLPVAAASCSVGVVEHRARASLETSGRGPGVWRCYGFTLISHLLAPRRAGLARCTVPQRRRRRPILP